MNHQQSAVPSLMWGTNREGGSYYAGRTHVASDIKATALCGLPIDTTWTQRPNGPPLCPECSITALEWLYPASPALPPGSTQQR
ncbi:hypothetical protein ACTG9Q_32270 [Actinokineospora sp. 24-640]